MLTWLSVARARRAEAGSDQTLGDSTMSSGDDSDDLGGSEDATFLMQAVQDQGGLACYVGVGTDHPGGHHTSTFDVVEDDIAVGIDVLSGAILRVADTRP